jgi:hypothetical protein
MRYVISLTNGEKQDRCHEEAVRKPGYNTSNNDMLHKSATITLVSTTNGFPARYGHLEQYITAVSMIQFAS